MTHGSLFSGIGGFDYAAQMIGWTNVFQVEIDDYCTKVLEKNFPNARRYRDIKEFNGTEYRGSIDVLTGGFPCQSFSQAGKRKGKDDERYLWPEMLRIIQNIQPAWIVAENVSGLLTMQNGLVFEQVCTDLEKEDYEVQPFIIPACAKNAPHRRDRIWIIANARHRDAQGTANQEKYAESHRARNAIEFERSIESDGIRFARNTQSNTSDKIKRVSERESTKPGRSDNDVADSKNHSAIYELPVANTNNARNRTRENRDNGNGKKKNEGWKEFAQRRISGHSKTHSDTTSQRLEGCIEANEQEGEKSHNKLLYGRNREWNRNWIEVATELCRTPNGLSDWLHRTQRGLNGTTAEKITRQNLPHLWQYIQQEAVQRSFGGLNKVQETENLFAILWQHFTRTTRQNNLSLESEEAQEAFVRNVWIEKKSGRSPQRHEYQERFTGKFADSLPYLSHEVALETEKTLKAYNKNRVQRLKGLGNAIVPAIAYEIFKAIDAITR